MNAPIVTVVSIGPSRRKNAAILAEASITISWGVDIVTINDLRVLQGKDGKDPWCGLPSFSLPDGKNWSYNPTVVLSKPLQERVAGAVLLAYQSWSKKTRAFPNVHGVTIADEEIQF